MTPCPVRAETLPSRSAAKALPPYPAAIETVVGDKRIVYQLAGVEDQPACYAPTPAALGSRSTVLMPGV